MSCLVREIIDFIETWAPSASAQSYDNVGLQVGHMDADISSGLIALDLTPGIVDEAIQMGAEIIVTHHPLIFNPIQKLSSESLVPSLALKLAEHRIALIAAHTNLDAARDGVSFHLAETVGLTDVQFLSGLDNVVSKLVVFVPIDHAEAVRDAAHKAGAGTIGRYSDCSFSVGGTGQFKPGSSTRPFIGKSEGQLERVHEVRIEMEVVSWKKAAVLAAIKSAHPYEELAYDLFPVSQPYRDAGIGAVGTLTTPMLLSDFLTHVCRVLEAPSVRYAGSPDKLVQRIAVCGGSGSDFIGLAKQAGADVYITGDITYHRFFDVLTPGGMIDMALIDAGHYETEKGTESLMRSRLKATFPSVSWHTTTQRSSPSSTWVAPE